MEREKNHSRFISFNGIDRTRRISKERRPNILKVLGILLVTGLIIFSLNYAKNKIFLQDGYPEVRAESTGAVITAPCSEDWQCEEWSLCNNGQQTRLCSDRNKCGTSTLQPDYLRSCESKIILKENEVPASQLPERDYWGVLLIILAGIGLIAITNLDKSRKKRLDYSDKANYWENESVQAYKMLRRKK